MFLLWTFHFWTINGLRKLLRFEYRFHKFKSIFVEPFVCVLRIISETNANKVRHSYERQIIDWIVYFYILERETKLYTKLILFYSKIYYIIIILMHSMHCNHGKWDTYIEKSSNKKVFCERILFSITVLNS